MAAERSPAYQHYVNEWRGSRAVQRMSFSERGVYREMLDQQWEDVTLPDDAGAVADLIAVTDTQRAEVLAAWDVVRQKFAAVDGQPGRVQNLRLERVRKDRKAFIRGAKRGGKARAEQAARSASGTFQPVTIQSPAVAPAVNQPVTSTSTSSSTPTSSSSSTASAGRRSAGTPPLNLGLRRLKVWRWMLDDLIDTLGDHAETFDIEAWLQALDAREKNVVPDVWPWLKNELIAEARRRGLPMVEMSDRKPLFTTSVEDSAKAVLAIVNQHGGVPR